MFSITLDGPKTERPAQSNGQLLMRVGGREKERKRETEEGVRCVWAREDKRMQSRVKIENYRVRGEN